MLGSLIYHMAMVTKMATESDILLKELRVEAESIASLAGKFYNEFLSDVKQLLENIAELPLNFGAFAPRKPLLNNEKADIRSKLLERLAWAETLMNERDVKAAAHLRSIFNEWTAWIVEMRLRQEYETIRGFLMAWAAATQHGLGRLKEVMEKNQESFGEQSAKTAVEVSLRAGLRRNELDKLMLSDHNIERTMDIKSLEGVIRFLNCPIYGSYKRMIESLGTDPALGLLFCRFFCYSHAKVMLDICFPFPFEVAVPKIMANDGVCEFHIKIAGGKAEGFEAAAGFVPLVVSWNVTLKCNFKCPHCYINATEKLPEELSTEEAKMLIDQIAEVSRPLLILSGGEPLLRPDLFEIIRYGKTKSFKIGVGSNGTLIDWETARRLKEAGVDTVSISLDSIHPEKHDGFRGVAGSWEKAVNAIKALRANGIVIQVNTTVSWENYHEISQILDFCDKLGVENFHLFFLVPTGRGVKMKDISPEMYESIMREVMKNMDRYRVKIKFTCAPQYMRIAHQTGASVRHIHAAMRGCIAGLYYCRIYPTGEVTPCPYLPIKLGNIREKSFKEIWLTSKVLEDLRHFERLKGKCGLCEYREVCGGCRARAYGLSSGMIDACGGLHEPTALVGDYLAEDPYCCYQPKAKNLQGGTTK